MCRALLCSIACVLLDGCVRPATSPVVAANPTEAERVNVVSVSDEVMTLLSNGGQIIRVRFNVNRLTAVLTETQGLRSVQVVRPGKYDLKVGFVPVGDRPLGEADKIRIVTGYEGLDASGGGGSSVVPDLKNPFKGTNGSFTEGGREDLPGNRLERDKPMRLFAARKEPVQPVNGSFTSRPDDYPVGISVVFRDPTKDEAAGLSSTTIH